jgi:hypothetical protein
MTTSTTRKTVNSHQQLPPKFDSGKLPPNCYRSDTNYVSEYFTVEMAIEFVSGKQNSSKSIANSVAGFLFLIFFLFEKNLNLPSMPQTNFAGRLLNIW